jgi:NAD(P)-dependent dehydrogenase (short-subunit alcohol dehydrogenase family)
MHATDRTVLITGGTGALGQVVTLAFLESGARVFATWHSESGRDTLLAAAGHRAARLSLDRVDVTDEQDVSRWVSATVGAAGPPEALVCLLGAMWAGRRSLKPISRPGSACWR